MAKKRWLLTSFIAYGTPALSLPSSPQNLWNPVSIIHTVITYICDTSFRIDPCTASQMPPHSGSTVHLQRTTSWSTSKTGILMLKWHPDCTRTIGEMAVMGEEFTKPLSGLGVRSPLILSSKMPPPMTRDTQFPLTYLCEVKAQGRKRECGIHMYVRMYVHTGKYTGAGGKVLTDHINKLIIL